MNATTVAVDLAKSVFQLAVADEHWRIVETQRLTRTQFERWFANRDVRLVVMEACGSAHHWARWLNGLGIEVRLLPAQYIRAYVKRNKTDAADAAALLEVARASDIRPVRVKSVEQQALQALQGMHRIRSLWMGTRTSRINALRGFCREAIPVGARTGIEAISRVLADPGTAVPDLIRGTAKMLLEEIRLLETRIAQLERELAALARLSPACTTLLSIPGIGLLTACPIRITKLLTDNGKEFTDRLFASREREPSGNHEFDQLCQELGIEHRLTKPRTPRTNGMVERFNGRIADVLKTHRFNSREDMEQTLLRYVALYNHQLPQSALGSKTPMQAMKNWHQKRPHLFHKRPYDRPGCDT